KAEIHLDAEEGSRGLYIPRGVAHGFYAQTDLMLQYLVDQYYTGDDEFGVAWDDPDVGIDWPARDPILSDRDRANPPLADVLKDAPAYESSAIRGSVWSGLLGRRRRSGELNASPGV